MKKLVIAATALASALALTAAEFASVSFETTGPDCYADGTQALQGECYALVWVNGGTFEGLNVDGTCVDPTDELIVALPWATANGSLPYTVFNIEADSKCLASGELALYLLDTRKFIDGQAKVSGVDAEGKLVFVNAASKVESTIAVAKDSIAAPIATTAASGAIGESVASALPEGVSTPKVEKIDFVTVNEKEYVKLTVSNTDGFINYAVQGGDTVKASGKVGDDAKLGGAKTITLLYPKTGDASFFKVIRK